MTYRIEITGDSLFELRQKLSELAIVMDIGQTRLATGHVVHQERDASGLKTDEPAPLIVETAEPTAKRRGRPPKDQATETSADVLAEAAEEERARQSAGAAESPEDSVAAAPASDAGAGTAPGSETTTGGTGPEPSTSADLTYADVRKRVLEISKLGDRDTAMGFLTSLGVDNAQKLHEDQWAEACDKADELLAKLRKEKV